MMETLDLHWWQPNRCVFAMAHHSLRETGTFMSPVHIDCDRHEAHNEEVLTGALDMDPSTSIHQVTYETTLRVQICVQCLRGSCILFMYNLYKGYTQGTTIFVYSCNNSFNIKQQMNNTDCTVYFRLMRQHSKE
jgi:hypothetical protein